MSSLLSHSDGILPIYNDDMLSTCQQLLKIKRPSYKIMNTVLAQSLLSITVPAANSLDDKLSLWGGNSPANSLQSIVRTLCAHPSYKMLSLRNIPQCTAAVSAFNADLWDGMMQRVRQLALTNSSENRINWSLKAEHHKSNKAIA